MLLSSLSVVLSIHLIKPHASTAGVNKNGHNSLKAYSDFYELVLNKPFVSIWNVPSRECETKYGIKFNLSFFDIDANNNDSFLGGEIVIFYRDRLGFYPWIDDEGTYVQSNLVSSKFNGPPKILRDLQRHLNQVEKDISALIPLPSFNGLAVIDWENWRPIFQRNKYNQEQKRYIRASELLVRQKHPSWSGDQIRAEAEKEFDEGARLFMHSTLELCRRLRPGGFWGFYGFPNCYNHRQGQRTCATDTQQYNDQLQWMFNTSSVLVPSIYVQEQFGSHEDRYWHVYGTLHETRRLMRKYAGEHVPILPYTRFKYADTGDLYDKVDLGSTIQQSAYAGFNGVTLWGSSRSFESQEDCANVRDYVQHTLGPFVKNLTNFMTACSTGRCNSHGRCVNTTWAGQDFKSDVIIDNPNTSPGTGDVFGLSMFMRVFAIVVDFLYSCFESTPYDAFSCECYNGWSGSHCDIHGGASSSISMAK